MKGLRWPEPLRSDGISMKVVLAALMILCGLICLATVFLKQHSVIDVACGGALSAAMDLLASPGRVSGMFQRLRRKKKKPALES